MQYQVLARKWRPKNFSEMVGQEAVVRTLSNALTQQRLHHAYLFTGTRGVGKTTIARIIAKCLNCETGITAQPCGQCSTCQAIDAGQFIDLIEVDAASRTKVEDTRELLDNVQYAPTQGRYKIYLIDEVHMLSGHSFNALLKTLEEPPEHVKFLLATTDPQKLPITVLSRCLQFHLKGIAPDIIGQHLIQILQQENIQHHADAIAQIANAADGSMRDALSLLDQAIAFSDSNITDESVRKLLGTTATIELYPLIDTLAEQNATGLLEYIKHLALQGISFKQVLNDLLQLLHQIACAQLAPQLVQEDKKLLEYAEQFTKQDIQLLYQIGLIGQRDLPYAPSARSGFEMVLLRMMSFVPEEVALDSQPTSTPKPKPIVTTQKTESDWSKIAAALDLSGMSKLLAQNCVLDKKDKNVVQLHIDAKHSSLVNDKTQAQLQDALSQYYTETIKLNIETVDLAEETPAKQAERQKDEKMSQVKTSLNNDPHVQSILNEFGGSLDEKSIKST